MKTVWNAMVLAVAVVGLLGMPVNGAIVISEDFQSYAAEGDNLWEGTNPNGWYGMAGSTLTLGRDGGRTWSYPITSSSKMYNASYLPLESRKATRCNAYGYNLAAEAPVSLAAGYQISRLSAVTVDDFHTDNGFGLVLRDTVSGTQVGFGETEKYYLTLDINGVGQEDWVHVGTANEQHKPILVELAFGAGTVQATATVMDGSPLFLGGVSTASSGVYALPTGFSPNVLTIIQYGQGGDMDNIVVEAEIPEPATLILMVSGLCMSLLRRKHS